MLLQYCQKLHEGHSRPKGRAEGHPLMGRMHKPDPKLPAEQQDMRSLIPLEAHDFDRWLTCTVEEAREMLKVPPVELLDAEPLQPSAELGKPETEVET